MEIGSNWPYFLLQPTFLECFMSNTSSLTTSFLFLSLQFTSFESSLLFTPYELQIESILSALTRQWSFAGAPVFVSNSFDNCFKLAPGFDLAPFRKNVVHSSPRPRCLGNWQLTINIFLTIWFFRHVCIRYALNLVSNLFQLYFLLGLVNLGEPNKGPAASLTTLIKVMIWWRLNPS